MSNSVIIISEDTEIYKSFERAFRHSNIEAQEWEDYIVGKPLSKEHHILVFTLGRDSLYNLIWNEVRGRYKLFNPIIALSFHSLNPATDLRDLIFKENYETYQYVKIPFLLEEIFCACNDLKPLRNEEERKLEIKSLSHPTWLLDKIDHELINLFGGEEIEEIKKERAIGFYTRVNEILQDLDSRNELITEVNEITIEIRKSTLSDTECRKFKLKTETLFSKILNEL